MLPESLWELIETAAAEDGVSAAQFIRDSTLLRIGYRHGEKATGAEIREMFEKVRDESP